jgi:hypothetical protein
MSQVYTVTGWDKIYENNRTRMLKDLMWIPVPNCHDGQGYCILMEDPAGTELLGAWLLILQVASKCPTRGTLARKDGKPHTAATIARQTRSRPEVIQAALDKLTDPEIGWLQVVDSETPENKVPDDGTQVPDDGTQVPDSGQRKKEGNLYGTNKEGRKPGSSPTPASYTLIDPTQNWPTSPSIQDAVTAVYAAHPDFHKCQRMMIENALKSVDRIKWKEAISALWLKCDGARLDRPIQTLVNYLDGQKSDDFELPMFEADKRRLEAERNADNMG